MSFHDIFMAILTFTVIPLALRAEWLYRKMPVLAPRQVTSPLPSLSIIVPARNEAPNLHRLLPTLKAQAYPGQMEIIVVDDNSQDNTAVVANYYGAKVLSLNGLPDGWLGKPHAAHQGAQRATGDWLLFTDADMAHEPTSAASALCHALEHHLDGLSVFPKQMTRGAVDRAALMAAFAALFAGLGQHSHTLNGQYMLLRRDVYENSGGMTAVCHEMLEDLALGQWLHHLGYNVPMVRGEGIASVYMYDSLAHLWQGMSRLGSGSLKYSGLGAIITALFITGALMPLLAPLFVRSHLVNKKWVGLTWFVVVPSFIPWGRRFGSGLGALLAPVGAAIVQLAACWGLIVRFLGQGILWKSRVVK